MCQDHECVCYDGEVYEKIERLESDLKQVVKAFAHMHINNGLDDFCRQCGLYLTHPVHLLQSNAAHATTAADKQGDTDDDRNR